MEKNLTDEEIVKAIDKCFAMPMKCEDGCPYFNKYGRNFCVEDNRFYHDLKDLIHRLQDENAGLLKENEELTISYHGVQNQAAKRIVELTKQVEKLTNEKAEQEAEIERLNKCVMSEVQVRKCCEDIIQDTMKQTVNDMGKEIYKRVTDNLKMWLRERYDVEVEYVR